MPKITINDAYEITWDEFINIARNNGMTCEKAQEILDYVHASEIFFLGNNDDFVIACYSDNPELI